MLPKGGETKHITQKEMREQENKMHFGTPQPLASPSQLKQKDFVIRYKRQEPPNNLMIVSECCFNLFVQPTNLEAINAFLFQQAIFQKRLIC